MVWNLVVLVNTEHPKTGTMILKLEHPNFIFTPKEKSVPILY